MILEIDKRIKHIQDEIDNINSLVNYLIIDNEITQTFKMLRYVSDVVQGSRINVLNNLQLKMKYKYPEYLL